MRSQIFGVSKYTKCRGIKIFKVWFYWLEKLLNFGNLCVSCDLTFRKKLWGNLRLFLYSCNNCYVVHNYAVKIFGFDTTEMKIFRKHFTLETQNIIFFIQKCMFVMILKLNCKRSDQQKNFNGFFDYDTFCSVEFGMESFW